MRVKKRFFCLIILFIVIAFFSENSNAITVGSVSLSADSVCSGANVQLMLINYSALSDSIYWQKKINGNWISIFGSSNDTIYQPIIINTYFRAVIDSSGKLFYTDSVLVKVKPVPVAVSSISLQTLCSDIPIDTIKLSTNPFLNGTVFSWSRTNTNNIIGVNSGNQSNIIEVFRNKTNVLQTTYINIVPIYNGCKGDTLKDTIIVKPEPVPFLNINSQNVCNALQIDTIFIYNQLQSTNYFWFRDNLQHLSGLESGTDSIISGILTSNNNNNQSTVFKIISENNNCYGDTLLAYVNVKVLPSPNKINGDSNVCKNQTLLYKALEYRFDSFHWNVIGGEIIHSNYPDSTEVQITWDSISANQHQLIMKEGLLACSVSDTLNVDLNNAKAPLPDSLIKMNNLNMLVCSRYINMPSVSFSYNWGYTDKNNPYVNHYINDFQDKSYCIFPHLQTSLYYYWLRTSFNDTLCDTYTYYMNEVPLFADEVKKPEIIDFNIYPNPCFDEFCISFNQEMKVDYKLKIYDMMGKLLFSNILNCENRDFTKKINIKQLKNAIYLIIIELENGEKIRKKIVKS